MLYERERIMEKYSEAQGNITLWDRHIFTADGVIDVLSFDEGLVSLSTSLGLLLVEGEEMRVKKMDMESGVVSLEGKISGMYYTDEAKTHKKGLFGRRK